MNPQGRPEFRHKKTGVILILIPKGSYTVIYSAYAEPHTVSIERPYLLGKYEVTNAQYRRSRAGHDSGHFVVESAGLDRTYVVASLNGDERPVVNVSCGEASEYCQEHGLRLPTSGEWEWAARAGEALLTFTWGNGWPPSANAGNFGDATLLNELIRRGGGGWQALNCFDPRWSNIGRRLQKQNDTNLLSSESIDGFVATAPVGAFAPNLWGLHDMEGNVSEWTGDSAPWGGETLTVWRGGDWTENRIEYLACERHSRSAPDSRYATLGFRVALSLGSANAVEFSTTNEKNGRDSTSRITLTDPQLVFAGRNKQGFDEYTLKDITLVEIPLNKPYNGFMMGSPDSEGGRNNDESQHWVKFSAKTLLVSKFPITNQQFRRFKKDHNSIDDSGFGLNEDAQPVVVVTWDEAKAYCNWAGNGLRLLTEAEWEFAARGGDGRIFPWGNDWPPQAGAGNFADKAFNGQVAVKNNALEAYDDGFPAASPVGRFDPNPYGLYDMTGNVQCWCEDGDGGYRYPTGGEAIDPIDPIGSGSGSGIFRLVRGVGWGQGDLGTLRCAMRAKARADTPQQCIGFRVALHPGTR